MISVSQSIMRILQRNDDSCMFLFHFVTCLEHDGERFVR